MTTGSDTLRNDVDEKKTIEEGVPGANPKPKLTKILNSKNEPAFALKLAPEHLVFKYQNTVPAFASFTITNTKPDRQAFKVKSSDNNMYRAKPSVGFIKPGETVPVRVLYLNLNLAAPSPNEAKKHVAVYHVSAGNAKTFKEAFAKKTDGVYHYYCNHIVDMVGGGAGDDSSTEGEKKEEKK